MDGMVDILEIVGDEYILNTKNLVSSLERANECNSIAVISIIGPKSHGKTFFISCLFNYMNSQYKDEWPACDDAIIKMDNTICQKNQVLKISSKPYTIVEKIENKACKTAVFLIDSDNIFDERMSSKKVKDISALLLLTSSTVIYNYKRELPVIKILLTKYLVCLKLFYFLNLFTDARNKQTTRHMLKIFNFR